jgi:hypothetical protein
MKRFLIGSVVLLAAASAYAATGDLTWKAFDPESLPLLERGSPAVDQQTQAAPADGGTVNPAARIATFRLGDRSLRIAIDSAKADDKALNLVRFDVAGTGKFAGQPTAPLKIETQEGAPAGYVMASFGPANVEWHIGSTTLPARVSGMWITTGNAPAVTAADTASGATVKTSSPPIAYAAMVVGTCLEGQCAFGDKTLAVRFIDSTSNLKMTDAPRVQTSPGVGATRYVRAGDLMQISADGGKTFKTYNVGQSVPVGGAWYEATVSDDGSKVTASPVKVDAGKLRIDAGEWSAQLVNGEHVLALEGDKTAVDLPVGKYIITQLSIQHGDEAAVIIDRDFNTGKSTPFEVTAGQTASPAIGPPITAKVDAAMMGREVTLNATITDAAGRSATLVVKTDRAPAEFEIMDAAGKRVDFATVEYT